jgi:hypothetical protein
MPRPKPTKAIVPIRRLSNRGRAVAKPHARLEAFSRENFSRFSQYVWFTPSSGPAGMSSCMPIRCLGIPITSQNFEIRLHFPQSPHHLRDVLFKQEYRKASNSGARSYKSNNRRTFERAVRAGRMGGWGGRTTRWICRG